jgi:hypothetical protein
MIHILQNVRYRSLVMIRWIFFIVAGLITLYAAYWCALMLWALFSRDGELIVFLNPRRQS